MADGAVIRIRQHYPFWGPLAERFELIAFDFRNHGSNPPAASGKDGHTYAQMALDLDACSSSRSACSRAASSGGKI